MYAVKGYMNTDRMLIGDYSKYIFLQWLVPDIFQAKFFDIEKIKDHPIWVFFSESFSIGREDDVYKIGTYKILPGQNLFVPVVKEGVMDLSPFPLKKDRICILFEECPFNKENHREMINQLSRDTKAVVLMDLPGHTGSTDLGSMDDAVAMARNTYKEMVDEVFLVKDRTCVNRVLYWQMSWRERWRKEMEHKLEKLQKRIDQAVYDYQGYLEDWEYEEKGCMNICSKGKICSYQSVKNNPGKSVWQAYTNQAVKCLFPDSRTGNLYDIVSLYDDITDDPVFNQSREKTHAALVKRLKARFAAASRKSGFHFETASMYLPDENTYIKETTKGHSLSGIDVVFMRAYTTYI